MASFSDVPTVRPLGGGYFELMEPFKMYIASGENKTFDIIAPAGFITNFASIPWFFHWIVKPDSNFIIRAAIIHDWLYMGDVLSPNGEYFTREQSDIIFMNGMYISGAPTWKIVSCYLFVSIFGNMYYK